MGSAVYTATERCAGHVDWIARAGQWLVLLPPHFTTRQGPPREMVHDHVSAEQSQDCKGRHTARAGPENAHVQLPRYKDSKIVYRRYASLFFICGIGQQDNELITLELIHRYVELLDRYFGNVCELDH